MTCHGRFPDSAPVYNAPMKIQHRLMLPALLLFALVAAPANGAEEPRPLLETETPHSILFTGNSFTFYNNAVYTHMRKLLMAEDQASRERIFLKSMTISGAVLGDHRGGMQQMLNSREWDVIVLQGHSREAIDPELMPNFHATLDQFSAVIDLHGARPVLFMTWAYSDRPEMITELEPAFAKLGKDMNIPVAPVGSAFAEAQRRIPGVVLHDEDRIHPSLAGTYLAAAVFYSTLYGKSPATLDYDAGLGEELAGQLRRIAWHSVQAFEGK